MSKGAVEASATILTEEISAKCDEEIHLHETSKSGQETAKNQGSLCDGVVGVSDARPRRCEEFFDRTLTNTADKERAVIT